MNKNSIEYNNDNYKNKYSDMVNSLKDFNIFLDNAIDAEMDKLPVSNMDAVRKSSYCLALERCKNSIFNILEGKPFNFVES